MLSDFTYEEEYYDEDFQGKDSIFEESFGYITTFTVVYSGICNLFLFN